MDSHESKEACVLVYLLMKVIRVFSSFNKPPFIFVWMKQEFAKNFLW